MADFNISCPDDSDDDTASFFAAPVSFPRTNMSSFGSRIGGLDVEANPNCEASLAKEPWCFKRV
jgi:hypothetical protein